MQITWDEWAVPTITGEDDADVVRGIGYAQAVAHAGQVLELYGKARGTAAAWWGPDFLKEDTFTAQMGLREVTRTWFDAQAPETLTRIEAFCDGFNEACADDETRGAARREVLPVTPLDVVAHCVRVMTRFNQVDPNQLAFSPTDFYGVQPLAGSSAWAVSAEKSSTGNAMVMINPHMAYILDYHRFTEFRTISPGRSFHGTTLIGVPWQSMGYSDSIGWAHTVNPIRNLSVHELDIDGDTYAWDGGRRELEQREHVLEVKGAEPVTVVERRTVHGPVVTAPDGTDVAVRISGVLHHPATTALESWWQMSKAASVRDLMDIHDRMWLPMFSIVAADSSGSVGALFCGTPWKRTHGDLDDSQRRLPGDDPRWVFDEVHPASAMPRVVDPPSGFVQNCNETPWLFTSPPLDPGDWPDHVAPRPDQLLDLRVRASHRYLTEHETVSPEELLELKYGTRALLADICLDQLVEAAGDDAELKPALDILKEWDREALPDSVGYPLFWVWALLSGPSIVAGGFFTPVDSPADVPAGMADPAAGVETLRGAIGLLGLLGIPLDTTWGSLASFGTDDDGVPVPLSGGAQSLGVLKCMEVIPYPTGPLVALGDTWISRVELQRDVPAIADSLLVYGNTTEPGAPPSRSQYSLWAQERLRPRG